METVLMIHSAIRVAVMVFAVIAILKFGFGWLTKSPFSGLDGGVQAAFAAVMDVQALFGLALLVGGGLTGAGFPLHRIEHAVVMIAAVAMGHLPVRWKNAPDAVRLRNNVFAAIAALVLIFIGVAVLGQAR